MSIALVGGTKNTGAVAGPSATVSLAGTSTAGSCLVLCSHSNGNTGVPTITDALGTWANWAVR